MSQRQWTYSSRRNWHPHRRQRAALAAVAIAAALGAACTEVGTDPDAPVSLAFDTLTAPSVVKGDTMRDVNGTAAPLAAYAFNADGDSISSAEIRFVFVPGDTTPEARSAITISDGFIIASATAPTAPASTLIHRVVAQAGSLQSQPPLTFSIVESPDAAEVQPPLGVSPAADTMLNYGVDTALTVQMRVLHDSTDASSVPVVAPVPSYLVEFRIDPDSAAPALLDSVRFVSNRRRSARLVDTTSSSGIASATVRVFVNPGAASAPIADSVVVRGYVNYGRDPTTGEPRPLRGSPVRLVVHLDPTIPTGAR